MFYIWHLWKFYESELETVSDITSIIIQGGKTLMLRKHFGKSFHSSYATRYVKEVYGTLNK